LTGTVLQAKTLDTRIGELEFTHDFADGYQTDATVKELLNEMDFQRAVQADIWAIPFASMAQWQYANIVAALDSDPYHVEPRQRVAICRPVAAELP